MKTYRYFIIALLALAGSWHAGAQTSVTPYSRLGYGILGENATGAQRQMGGVGYAGQDSRQVNTMNPASYAHTDSLTFLWNVGIDLTNVWSKENGKSGYSFGAASTTSPAASR